MARYAGDTIRVATYATLPDGALLVNTDVDTAQAFVYDSAGMLLDSGDMFWDSANNQWFFNWVSPEDVGDGDFVAKTVLISTSLNFTSNEWREFSVKPSPI